MSRQGACDDCCRREWLEQGAWITAEWLCESCATKRENDERKADAEDAAFERHRDGRD